ncbi:MAG: 50S ribosomal protein L29 [Dehalococcoidia bacterium]
MKLRDTREQRQSLRNATDADLHRQLDDLYRELFNLRMRHVTRQLDNDRQVPSARKSIARLKTILRERELARALQGEE